MSVCGRVSKSKYKLDGVNLPKFNTRYGNQNISEMKMWQIMRFDAHIIIFCGTYPCVYLSQVINTSSSITLSVSIVRGEAVSTCHRGTHVSRYDEIRTIITDRGNIREIMVICNTTDLLCVTTNSTSYKYEV